MRVDEGWPSNTSELQLSRTLINSHPRFTRDLKLYNYYGKTEMNPYGSSFIKFIIKLLISILLSSLLGLLFIY